MAVMASALRRLDSIKVLRAAANCVALRVGRRVSTSVSRAMETRMIAPPSAVSPI